MKIAGILALIFVPGPGDGPAADADRTPELLREAKGENAADADRAFLDLTEKESASVPGLRKVLAQGPADLRPIAARALAAIGPAARPAAEELLTAARDPDAAMRTEAIRALVEIRPQDERLANAFTIATADANPEIRRLAIEGLARLGLLAAEATPALATLVAREAPADLKARAAEALGRIGPAALPVSFALMEGLRSPDPVVAARSAQAIVRLGRLDRTITEMILNAADNEREAIPLIRMIAVLGNLGSGGRAASDWLHEQLEHPDALIRRAAGAALEQIESP